MRSGERRLLDRARMLAAGKRSVAGVKPEEKRSALPTKFRLSRGIGDSGGESGFEFGGGGREGAACFPTYPEIW